MGEKIDRISELEESIIHLIFNFMRNSKDVARTSVLSKYWKEVFHTYRSFDFDERCFRVPESLGSYVQRIALREKFKKCVKESFETRVSDCVAIFKLRIFVDDGLNDAQFLECVSEWIHVAMGKNLKELDIHMITRSQFQVNLTQSNTLTCLKLSGCSFGGLAAMVMPKLRVISIREASYFDEGVMANLVRKSPLLEDLRIVCCPRLVVLNILSLDKLKRVEVQDCARLKQIVIASPNLETFLYGHAIRTD